MTKLEAVQKVLINCGHLPVGSLDTNGASTASNVERVIDQVEEEIQGEGWHYNTRDGQVLTPDGMTDRIAVPTGTLAIDSTKEDCHSNVTQIGGFLYDHDNLTYEFANPIKVKVVIRFEFACIPPQVQQYIVAEASARFFSDYGGRSMRGDPYKQRVLEQRSIRAKGEARRFNTLASDVNLLQTAEANRLVNNRQPYTIGRVP